MMFIHIGLTKQKGLIKRMKELCFEERITDYINKLKTKNDFIIFFVVKDTMGYYVGEDIYSLLNSMGLNAFARENSGKDNFWKGYIAVIDNGNVLYEKLAEYNGSVNYNNTLYDMDIDCFSSPYKRCNVASVLINNKEYAVNQRGFNIVVFDKKRKCVIDSVCFDTHVPERKCYRNDSQIEVRFNALPKNNVILRDINSVVDSLDIKKIIPKENQIKNTGKNKKIRVRFYFWGRYNLWNAMESIAMAFNADSRFDVLVVRHDNMEKNIIYLAQSGLRIVPLNKYNIEKDAPDIGIYNINPNYMVDVKKVRFNVVAYAGLVGGQFSQAETYLVDIVSNIEDELDAVIVDENIYRIVQNVPRVQNEKWFSFCNAKFDSIYNHINKCSQEYPESWSKINGKTVILWAFDHNYQYTSVTFDLYISHILEFALKNKEIAIIIRPHVNYPIELIQAGIWSEYDYQTLIRYCDLSENVIWDETKDYGCAYAMSDAVITDINCGITISALAMNKPLAVLHRFDGSTCEAHFPDIHKGIYQIHSLEEWDSFAFQVANGIDPLLDIRTEIKNTYIKHFDGKNGQRIKDFVVEKYFENDKKQHSRSKTRRLYK